jgi:hypothetical protein
MKRTNETYTISVSSPLIRPGITLQAQASKRYLVQTLHDLFEMVRQFNQEQDAASQKPAS